MSRFVKIADNVDPAPLLLDLLRAPDLWDADPGRRTYEGSPHTEMVDICVRYMHPQILERGGLEARRMEHRNIFWPAWYQLPSLRPVVYAMMAKVQAVELGSILITKLPPHGKIAPHHDGGNWAPEYYNTKAHWTIQGSALVRSASNWREFKAGSVWTFDNLLEHEIHNNAEEDRICVIVSMRVDP